jgi:nucleoside-diphosphate-sugar epimerase
LNKTILITGASGFIGRFLINEALIRNYEVYAVVRKSSNIEHLKDKAIHIVYLDFTNYPSMITTLSELPPFTYIIHAAGITKSFKSQSYYDVNVENTKKFVNAIVQSKNIPNLFLLMSSLAAFGPGSNQSSLPVCNDDMPIPITHYGISKQMSESIVTHQTLFPYIILRPTAVYGPGEKDIFQSIKLMNKHFDFMIGSHIQYLTFVYVQDLVDVCFNLLEANIKNKAYFVTDGSLYSKKDLGRLIEKKLNKKVFHIAVPLQLVRYIALVTETIARIVKYQATALNYEKVNELAAVNWNCDIGPLEIDIGYKAKYKLEDGINETIEWYKNEGWLS